MPRRSSPEVQAPGVAEAESLEELLADLPDDLRRQAFTHASWVEHRAESYERLAFLGDGHLAFEDVHQLVAREGDGLAVIGRRVPHAHGPLSGAVGEILLVMLLRRAAQQQFRRRPGAGLERRARIGAQHR